MRTAHDTTLIKKLTAAGVAGLLGWSMVAPGLAAAAGSSAGGASSETYTVGDFGLGSVKLTGRTFAFAGTLPLPGSWNGAQANGRLELSSTDIHPGSTLHVLVDGSDVATVTLHDGTQNITFSSGALPAGGVKLALSGSLTGGKVVRGHTVVRPTVAVAPNTVLAVNRTGLASLPTLSQVPDALANHLALQASPLTVVFPAVPSTTDVRAAMVAAGAVARADTYPGIKVSALVAPTPAQLAGVTGPILTIDDTGSHTHTGALSLQRLASGSLDLTVSGSGQSLLGAARLLSSPWMRSLSGESARVPQGLQTAAATQALDPSSVSMTPASASGVGALMATSMFEMPVDQVIARGQAVLRLALDYDAPRGGRVTIALNGNTLGTYNAPPQGQTLRISTFKLSANWTENGNLLPGYYLQPGINFVTVTATPAGRSQGSSGRISVDSGSGVAMSTSPRPVTTNLSLWPFPFYGAHAWTRTTVVLSKHTDLPTLSALLAAMANTERITGVPADPQITTAAPTVAQRDGDMIVVGNPGLAALPYGGPLVSGLLAETNVIDGGVALIALDAQSLGALGQGYEPDTLSGRAVLVAPNGSARTVESAPPVAGFEAPSHAWLKPAALIALIVLGWIVVQARRARRRLVDLPPMTTDGTVR
jgi:hypothetical protein